MDRLKTLLRNLGPGLLFASMAIGTSHLVLSTKAGATYGWIMLVPIVLANILKYPFFEFGIRYTNVTGRSLVEGYSRRGRIYMWVYAGITLVTTFTILAALYVVTAGLLSNLFGITGISVSMIALGLFAFISAALIIGRYSLLEHLSTAMVAAFTLTTLVCVALLRQTAYSFSAADLWEGLQFHLPPDGVAIAVAAFGITGIGTTELIYYPYWCIEKGYPSYLGAKRDVKMIRKTFGAI